MSSGILDILSSSLLLSYSGMHSLTSTAPALHTQLNYRIKTMNDYKAQFLFTVCYVTFVAAFAIWMELKGIVIW